MKKERIDLHLDKKRAISILLIFALFFTLISLLSTLPIKTDCSQLSSLLRSSYVYSANVTTIPSQDSYYQLNAGISFMLSPNAQSSINAEILMQSLDTCYSEAVDWNTEKLGTYSLAITEGLAQTNDLRIGDKLYSKNVVDGITYEYTIDHYLPDVQRARASKSSSLTDGLILMGYDEKYAESITSKVLVFTRESVEDLTEKLFEMPVEIVYRSDEIWNTSKRIIPYFLLLEILAILAASCLVFVITKQIKHNFKRLMTLGFEKANLNNAYNRQVLRIGIPSILISICLTVLLSHLAIFSFVEALVLGVIILTELVTVLVMLRLSRRQLWR